MTERVLHVKRVAARRVLGGIPARTFAQMESEGIIVPIRRGRRGRPSIYDLAEIVPAYIAYVTSQRSDAAEARARRDRSLADLNELRLAERRRKLLPRDQVVRDGVAIVTASRAKLLALPRRLSQAGLPREYEPTATEIVREALEELSQMSTLADLQAADGGTR